MVEQLARFLGVSCDKAQLEALSEHCHQLVDQCCNAEALPVGRGTRPAPLPYCCLGPPQQHSLPWAQFPQGSLLREGRKVLQEPCGGPVARTAPAAVQVASWGTRGDGRDFVGKLFQAGALSDSPSGHSPGLGLGSFAAPCRALPLPCARTVGPAPGWPVAGLPQGCSRGGRPSLLLRMRPFEAGT